jgi:DNA-directed RNA polymerase subunit beta'
MVGFARTAQFLDAVKDEGFERATTRGPVVLAGGHRRAGRQGKLISEAETLETSGGNYEMGFITENERYNQVIDVWTRTNNRSPRSSSTRSRTDRDGFNAIYMMADSGARGSKEQIRQLGGMRGLMAKPQKSLSAGPARSSRTRSSPTSRKASPCSSTSSRRTVLVRVLQIRRSRRPTPGTSPAASWT